MSFLRDQVRVFAAILAVAVVTVVAFAVLLGLGLLIIAAAY